MVVRQLVEAVSTVLGLMHSPAMEPPKPTESDGLRERTRLSLSDAFESGDGSFGPFRRCDSCGKVIFNSDLESSFRSEVPPLPSISDGS